MALASTASKPRLDWRIAVAFAALLAISFYLLMSAAVFRIGFPLDDTWIHLTYARNFAEHGEWAFRLGESSAGSTAPLWTLLLSIGYFLNLAPYFWTFFLGWLVLTALGISAETVARNLIHSYKPQYPWAGIFFVFAWHLTWAAVSGMETLLHGLFAFVILTSLIVGTRRYLALGLLVGLSVWVRPDGLTLLGPVLFTALFAERAWSARGKAMLKIIMGFGALFLFYLLFNLALSGSPFPNTYYAKQAEYEEFWLSKSLTERVVDYLLPIFVSPFVALVPGVYLWTVTVIRLRNWGALAGAIWFLSYIAIYFMRLPAYQHGRYIIPALPIIYLYGMLGFLGLVTSSTSGKRIVTVWQSLLVVFCLAFTFVGARQNANDVSWIETQMVETSKWIRQNLPPDALLAVHDIGAVGYFTEHRLLDMAGLVSPEVVPFIRDETRLAEYLDTKSADYLITLPSFYPILTSGKEPLYIGSYQNRPVAGERMVIYRWR